jgi:serine/threonine-protein kinase ATR
MVHRSCEQDNNKWNELFFACRTALRTQAGLPVAEFLLPLLVLDRVCFGDSIDETILIQEIHDVLVWGMETDILAPQMPKTERQKAASVVFRTLDMFQSWSESEIEQRNKNSRRTQIQSSALHIPLKLSGDEWPLDESIARIDALLKLIPLEVRSRAASSVGMHAYSLRLLELDIRSGIANELYGVPSAAKVQVAGCKAAGTCDKSQFAFMKDILSSLNDYETMVALGENDFWSNPISRAQDSIQRNVALEDWDAALQDYERLQQLNTKSSASQLGSLRCLLELGHFESVLCQARGIGPKDAKGQDAVGCDYADVLPIAVEAAWRLGRWEVLSDLVDHASECFKGAAKPYPICFAEMLLDAQKQNLTSLVASIDVARNVVIDSLSVAARESYNNAYNHIAKLQCLCEVEDVAELICSKSPILTDTVNNANLSWDRRLSVASSTGASLIINTRLALARLAKDRSYEGSLFLSIGTSARKKGQFGMAASAFAKAEAAVASLDVTRMSPIAPKLRLQYAKLKYSKGEVNTALKIIGQENLESIVSCKGDEIDTRAIRSILGSQHNGLNEQQMKDFFVKGTLQSTRWMIDGGLKGGGEIISRFRTIHLTAPKWEKGKKWFVSFLTVYSPINANQFVTGHFQYAKYIDAVLRSRIIAIEKRRAISDNVDDDSTRFRAIASDKCCQKYVLLAMKHYSIAMSLDVRHVYQALPRLLSLWFDCTSIKTREVELLFPLSDDSVLLRSQEQANSLMEKNSKTIPAQAFYTAIPQLVSRISHNDVSSLPIKVFLLSIVLNLQSMKPF